MSAFSKVVIVALTAPSVVGALQIKEWSFDDSTQFRINENAVSDTELQQWDGVFKYHRPYDAETGAKPYAHYYENNRLIAFENEHGFFDIDELKKLNGLEEPEWSQKNDGGFFRTWEFMNNGKKFTLTERNGSGNYVLVPGSASDFKGYSAFEAIGSGGNLDLLPKVATRRGKVQGQRIYHLPEGSLEFKALIERLDDHNHSTIAAYMEEMKMKKCRLEDLAVPGEKGETKIDWTAFFEGVFYGCLIIVILVVGYFLCKAIMKHLFPADPAENDDAAEN